MDIVRALEIIILLSLVVFVHELGHFLVARWCGVLVERFSIGFGPVLLSFKRGDTEYALSAIPLGGYVKMLGQAEPSESLDPVSDERSYQNKPVGARMAIISAGVVMNVIFGFLCFAVAYHLGVPTVSSTIGWAVPGKPAWKAGLRNGDEITAINGHQPTDFELLKMEVALTRPKRETVHFEVNRQGKTFEVDVAPVQESSTPVIGVLNSLSLELHPEEPFEPNTPAARATNPSFEGGDTILAVNGVPVRNYFEYLTQLQPVLGATVKLTVQRAAKADQSPRTEIVALEPSFVRTLGLQMQPSEIVAIQQGSPALRAKDPQGNPASLQLKDLILAVDGVEEIDPMRLPEIIAAKAGKPVELTIAREGKKVPLIVEPEAAPAWLDFPEGPRLEDNWPMSVPALGIAYNVLPTVRKVAEGSPAALAATPIRPNDVVTKAEFIVEPLQKPRIPVIDIKDEEWPKIFWAMQFPLVRKVRLTVERDGEPFEVELEPKADPTWPIRLRGLNFTAALSERKAANPMEAIWMGLYKTRFSITRLYLVLRGLIIGAISPMNLVGPVIIFQQAYYRAQEFPLLVEFLALLSINLAVINFLPIPVLDGGHMFFLTYELLFRRQPSERMVVIANYFGLFLLLGLMIFVLSLDILRVTGGI